MQSPKQPRGSEACVWNIWKDVKLLTHTLIVMIGFFLFWICRRYICLDAGEWWAMMKSPLNEDASSFAVIWRRDAFVTYLPFSISLSMATGQAKNRHVVFKHVKIKWLYGFRNLKFLPISSDGTVASSKDVERFPLHCFSRLVIHHFLSGVTEVFFCTYDAFHISNSIRCFWASVRVSVCVCVLRACIFGNRETCTLTGRPQ